MVSLVLLDTVTRSPRLTSYKQLYAVTSLDDVLATNIVSLPLAAMYQQATRSTAGTFGLLFIFLLDIIFTIPGAYITCGRTLWTLGRDDATPFSSWFGRISPRWRNQFNATLVCGCCVTLLGVIYIASVAAFDAIIVSGLSVSPTN